MTPTLFLSIGLAAIFLAAWLLERRGRKSAEHQVSSHLYTARQQEQEDQREIKLLRQIIEQNAEVQKVQSSHIRSLDFTITDGRAHNKKLLDALHAEQDANRTLSSKLDQAYQARISDATENRAILVGLRQEHAGDLMHERQRFDDFVRDTMDKLFGGKTPAVARSSSTAEAPLPTDVQNAIEEVAFGNVVIEAHLEKEARRRLGANAKPADVAELIRAGEVPA